MVTFDNVKISSIYKLNEKAISFICDDRPIDFGITINLKENYQFVDGSQSRIFECLNDIYHELKNISLKGGK